MKKKSLVSVVVVSKDRKKDLIECVDGYLKSSYKPLEIIVVDNASKPPLKTWFKKKYPKVKLIQLDSNAGAAEGRNIGFRESSGKYIIFSDDDAYPDRHMVKYLVEAFETKKDAGIIQPLVYDKQKKNLLQGAGHAISTVTGRITAWGVREEDNGQYEGLRRVPLCGCVWMVKRAVFDKIGEYDEEYFIPYEDSDFCLRSVKAGFNNYCYSKAKSWHQGLKTTYVHPWLEWLGITSAERSFRVARNKLIFMRKHATPLGLIVFFGILLPVYIVLHTLIIAGSGKLNILKSYWNGLLSGMKYVFLYNKASVLKAFLSTGLIVFLCYLNVHKSFNLSIFGDDWIVFYGIDNRSGPGDLLDFRLFKNYFGPYALPHFAMALIRELFGYSSTAYYFISFITRTLAALALAGLAFYLTRNILTYAITGILFATSLVGMESTNWVFNMTSYIAISLFAVSLTFLFASKNSFIKYLISILFLIPAIMFFPQRMHGSFIIFGIYFLLIFIQSPSFKSLVNFLLRVGILGVVLYGLTKLNTFGGIGDANWFLGEVTGDLAKSQYYFWATIFGSFTNSFIPNQLWVNSDLSQLLMILLGNSTVTPRMGLLMAIFFAISIIIAIFIKQKKLIFLMTSIVLGIAWYLFSKQMYLDPMSLFHSLPAIYATIVGVFVCIWVISYWMTLNKKSKEFVIIPVLLSIAFSLLLISWARSRFFVMDTTFRYMITAGIGFPLLIGFIISKTHRLSRYVLTGILIVVVYINLNYSSIYFDNLLKERNQILYNSLWNQFNSQTTDYRPSKDFSVFYFEGNGGIIYNVFAFGFIPKISVMHNTPDEQNSYLPLVFDDKNALVKTLNAGYGPNKPIPPENIYAFRVDEEKVINIKDEILPILEELGYSYTIKNSGK